MNLPIALPPRQPSALPPSAPPNGSPPAKTPLSQAQHSSRYDGSLLSPRDQAIIEGVEVFHQLTCGQIQRLYFPAGRHATQARKARNVLGRLVEAGELKRIEKRVIGGWASGSQGFTYTMPARDPQTRVPHTWSIAELFVRLVEAERQGLCQVTSYQPEEGVEGYPFIPDAQIRLVLPNGSKRRVWVEVDNTKARISEKVRAYELAEMSWKQDKFPAILFTARDQSKLGTIRRAIGSSSSPHLFRACLFNEAVATLTS